MSNVEWEEVDAVERSRAFKKVFGTEGKRDREQEIVYQELCKQFMFMPCFQMVQGVGMDTHLAASISGKKEIAKTIYDLTHIPEVLIKSPEPEITRSKQK